MKFTKIMANRGFPLQFSRIMSCGAGDTQFDFLYSQLLQERCENRSNLNNLVEIQA